MKRWKLGSILTLAMALGVVGCGSSTTSSVVLTITPITASVITNTTQQFSSNVTGSTNTTVTWTLACATGVTAPACGTINSTTGLYTAPAVLPTVPGTNGGLPVVTPTATITATSQADTTKIQTATLTIITGISISITPNSATIGTGETFSNFTATVNNPGCIILSNPTCLNVTWSLPTVTTAGSDGTINATTGVYTAPSTAPSPNTIIVTATSVADTSVTSTAVITIVTSIAPTVTLVSPNVMALGGLFQDTYIAGTNFISTNNVFINSGNGSGYVPLPSSLVADVSSTLIRIRIPDYILASPPASGVLQVSVSQQVGTPQTCTVTTQCQIIVQNVRPAISGLTPDSVSQSASGGPGFQVDGGFYGTGTNPAVSASFNGQLRAITLPASGATNSTRQMNVTIGGNSNSSDLATPGLYPVQVQNNQDASKFAVTNLTVKPNYSVSSLQTLVQRLPVGTTPSDIAINPATGIAVVANTGSNDVSLIDLTAPTPAVVATICTAAVGAIAPCPASGPISVAVDYVRNIALVANSTTIPPSIAVIDLQGKKVSYVVSLPPSTAVAAGSPVQADTPGAVGINPVTGRALVAMQVKGYGLLMDVTQTPPAFVGPVTISTGPHTRIAVEPHLNWAVATPGGAGSVGIVDLNRQSANVITNLSRTSIVTSNVVTVTVQPTNPPPPNPPQPPLTIKAGDAVLIQNASATDSSFDGIYTVSGIGPGANQFTYTQTGSPLPDVAGITSTGTINYSEPVATVGLTPGIQGIAINAQTQQAVLVDPSSNGVVTFFNLVDQSVNTLGLTFNNGAEPGTVAAAFNPLTNTIITANPNGNILSVIDPTTPIRLVRNVLTQPSAVAVAIDPSTNMAVTVNQTDNSVTILSLGGIQSFSITETSPKTYVASSTLTSPAAPSAVTLTVLGNGFSSTAHVRLDGVELATTFVSGRQLNAIVPPSLLSSAHRFVLDVQNSSGGIATNAEDFTVEQSVDVSGACASSPYPAGVAIDPLQNLVAVSLEGCNSLALISLADGTGRTVSVGNNPVGVAVFPRLHLAVVANSGSPNASVVDELSQTVILSPATASGSIGVSADQDTGEAAVANSLASTVSIINVTTGGSSSTSTGLSPVATAFNNQNHQIAVASAGSNTVGFGNAGVASLASSFSVSVPTSVVYDPVPSDCGPSNTAGCFLATSSTTNVVEIIDPTTSSVTPFRVGINPTAIAYNYLTSTLVSTNTLSHTVTVSDFLAKRIRAVLTLPPSPPLLNLAATGLPQFALDIHPLTNLAVIADTSNGRVLFVPIPK
jgi:DNA-binding beta-propeller fold protein YncE